MPLLEKVFSILSPHECLVCKEEGLLLCVRCSELEIASVPSRCYRCQKVTKDSAVCSNCHHKVALRHVWVRSIYEGPASELVLRFKFERAQAAHKPIAHGMADCMPLLPSDTILVGVPTATSRLRQRGYDHVRLITRELSSKTSLLFASPVVRSGQAHQFGSSRTKRLEQLKDSFHVVDSRTVVGKRILLVDDVLTTGATLETMAEVLKNAGARQVDAVVFAQKL